MKTNINYYRTLLYVLFTLFFYSAYSQTILMEKKNGVYIVPCIINGLKLKFIFDTGASDVSISLSEAMFMIKNGYIEEKDLIGSEYYKIANGDIAEGTKIIIRKLEIGNNTLLNVEASVVHTLSAPLLLGQSAIQRFGKYSVDYSNNTLTLGNPTIPDYKSEYNKPPSKYFSTNPDCYLELAEKFEKQESYPILDGTYDDVIITIRSREKGWCYNGKVDVENGCIKQMYLMNESGEFAKYFVKRRYNFPLTITNGKSKTDLTLDEELINVFFYKKLK